MRGDAAGRGGMVVWLTGLSGAGKSTLGRRVAERLRGDGVPTLLLDGNEVRDAIEDPHVGFDVASRLTAAYRMSRLAGVAEAQGLTAVVATIALFHEVQEWNRLHYDRYLEVYVRVPVSLARARDTKGVYAREGGGGRDVWGVDIPIEAPKSPDLLIERREGGAALAAAVDRVVERVHARRREPTP